MARIELENKISFYIRNGYHIISDSYNTVSLKKEGDSINNLLHLILTIFTCGLWLIVWLLLICVSSERDLYVTLSYDEYKHKILVNNAYIGENTTNSTRVQSNERNYSTNQYDDNIVEKMRQLKDLYNLELITQEEYEKKKKDLLG